MFYRIGRNAEAEICIEDDEGEYFESKRVIIYFDTYIHGNCLIEIFNNDKGLEIYKFLIEKYDLTDAESEDFSSEVMYIPSKYVDIIDVKTSPAGIDWDNFAFLSEK